MPGILHFGVGNFHRAHQAVYVADANLRAAEPWQITGVSLRSSRVRDFLAPQDFAYTLVTRDAVGARYRKIEVHDDILVGGEDSSKILTAIADGRTRVITLTISEKGYCLDPGSGLLDFDAPGIQADLKSELPTTAVAFLARGLALRAAGGRQPIDVICCDNLSENGDKLRNAVLAFSKRAGIDPSFLSEEVSFPNTMVDRIVPATTEELREEVQSYAGWADASPVSTEAFSQWYITDNLKACNPPWHEVGVSVVEDVAPFELRKLRLLNGSHSLLAYQGLLAGHTFVHEAIKDPTIRAHVVGFWNEAKQTLPQVSKIDAGTYVDALVDRFENPNLNHRLDQIAMDGSLKLPIRILPVIEELKAVGSDAAYAHSILLAWAGFVVRCLNRKKDIMDPNHESFQNIYHAGGGKKQIMSRLVGGLASYGDRVKRC